MRFVPRKLRYTMMLVSMSATLAACGGGGSSGGSSGGGSPVGGTPGEGYAILSWEAPVTREDGSCLDDLAAFRVSYGLAPGVYDKTETVSTKDMSAVDTGRSSNCDNSNRNIKSYSYVVEDLGTASWYFAVQAVDSAGNVSAYSNEAIKTIQ